MRIPKYKPIVFTALLLFLSLGLLAQTAVSDSLKKILKNSKEDTSQVHVLLAIVDETYSTSLDTALVYCKKATSISEKLNFTAGKRESYGWMGYLFEHKNNGYKAIDFYTKGLKLEKEKGDNAEIAATLNNMGLIYSNWGDVPKAMEYLIQALELMEEIKDDKSVISTVDNLGGIYMRQGDTAQAIAYYEKGLELSLKIKNKKLIAQSYNWLGIAYKKKMEFDKALSYFEKSLSIYEGIKNNVGMANSFNNIGTIYMKKKEFRKALEYLSKGLKIQKELKDDKEIANCLCNIGTNYWEQKNLGKALEYFLKGMKLSKELGYPDKIRIAASDLYSVYKAKGEYKLALENYELHIKMRDSITNETTRKAGIKNQLKYEYEKQAAADSVANAKESEIKNVELKRQSTEIKAKKNQQYALFGGLFLVCLFSIFMYNRFKVTKKQKIVIENQKEIVEEQKKLVEEKQHEILDSIKYARRIQLAQIPTEKRVALMLNKLKK